MSRFLKESLQALDAYTPGEQPRNMEFIKLNTNESPYPPAPSVVAAMTGEEVEKLRLYSDPTAKGLKEKLLGTSPKMIWRYLTAKKKCKKENRDLMPKDN